MISPPHSAPCSTTTIPIVNISLRTHSDGDAIEVDPQQVQAFIQQQINGQSDPAPTNSDAAARSEVTVDVFNANGATGLAGRVLSTLTAQGFSKGQAVTATTRSTTVIDYAPGEEAAADGVATVLGGGIRLGADSALAAGHVRVYLGEDYPDPGRSITAPAAFHPDRPPTRQPSETTDPLAAGGVACIN